MRIKDIEDIKNFLPEKNIEREILSKIKPWLYEKEIIVLLGARQTGKTTLMFQIVKELLLSNRGDEIYYFNLDFPDDMAFFKDPDNIVNLVTGNQHKKFIFIDEVQRIKDAGTYLKHIYDLGIPVKIIVSGSGSLELKSRISEPLTGRKISFSVFPFSIRETEVALSRLSDSIEIKGNSFQHFDRVFDFFITYGGYPSIVLTGDIDKRFARLNEIYTSYLEKDIKNFLEIKNEQAFSNLVSILSSSIGNLLNKSEISNTLSIHLHTLDNYIYFLEQTFVIDVVRPFFRNARKEIVKSPKIYFNDIGIRNFAIRNFNSLNLRPDKGFIYENFVYLILKESSSMNHKLNFWRTKSGAEVDFIVQNGAGVIPVEVKAKNLKEPAVSQAMRSFIKMYRPDVAFIINFNLDRKIIVENCHVNFMSTKKFVSFGIRT